MRPVTDRFAAAVRVSHSLVTSAELLSSGSVVVELAIDDGSVTLDQTSASRGRCDVTLAGTSDVIPTGQDDPLAPYGNEVRLSRGIEFPDGTVELVALGVFRLEDVEVSDTTTDATIRLTGLDRSARLIDARFEAPYQVAASGDYAEQILELLQAAWPDVPVGSWPTGATSVTPALVAEEGGDRWAFAQSMAEAIGHDLFFDGDGELTLVPSSTLSTGSPVVTLAEGDGGVLLQAGRRWTRQGAFNRVIATGENTGLGVAPPRGVATDDNHLSATYYYGPFGRVPRFYSSPFLATDAQATDAAAAILARELGTTQTVSFGSLVLPHLEPGDVARITRARAGIDENHVIDSLTIPLSAAGTLTGATRAVPVTS